MEEHPIQTSTSTKRAHFMEEHPIQTSTSTKRAHFMDEWTDRRLLRHGEMALEYLWAGVS